MFLMGGVTRMVTVNHKKTPPLYLHVLVGASSYLYIVTVRGKKQGTCCQDNTNISYGGYSGVGS